MPTVTTPASRSLLTGGGVIRSGPVPYVRGLHACPQMDFLVRNQTGCLNFPNVDEMRKRAVYEQQNQRQKQGCLERVANRSTDKGFWSWNSKDGIIGTLDWEQVRVVWLISAAFQRLLLSEQFLLWPVKSRTVS